MSVAGKRPLGLFNVFLGAGCATGTPPTLHAVGTPPQALLGNSTFGLRTAGNAPSQPNYLFFSRVAGTHAIGPCTSYLGTSGSDGSFSDVVQTDASGVAVHAIPIPNKIALEGLDVYFQAAGRRPGGRLFSKYELSDELLVRIGNSVGGCP